MFVYDLVATLKGVLVTTHDGRGQLNSALRGKLKLPCLELVTNETARNRAAWVIYWCSGKPGRS